MVFTIASLLIRFVAGKASDRYGRIRVINTGLVLLIISMSVIGYSSSVAGLMLGACIYGVGSGVLSPALNAWTIDMSLPDHRGKAMATMYIAMEAGIGLSALGAGWYFQDVIAKIPSVMYASAATTIIALCYMLLRKNIVKAV